MKLLGAVVIGRLGGWPALLLLGVGLASLLAFNVNRATYYAQLEHSAMKNLAIADTLFAHGFAMFRGASFADDGAPILEVYSRFPAGGFALLKLATMPFGDALAAQVFAARLLMLACLVAAMMLAYHALRRITANGWIALAATSMGFSSYYILEYSTVVSPEMMMDLLGVMLTLHGMVVFTQDGKRFRQLWIKSCAALLIGWHVYALLAPFVLLGLGGELAATMRSRRGNPSCRTPGSAIWVLLRLVAFSRYSRLGLIALLFGTSMLAVNFTSEYVALEGRTPLAQLPSVRSMTKRTGLSPVSRVRPTYGWSDFLPRQFYRVVGATVPGAVEWPGRSLERPPSMPPLPLIGAGVLIAGVVFLWLPFARGHRLVLGSLALSGFCWAFGMRGNTWHVEHDFEALYFVGVPLTLVAMALVALRRFAGASTARLLPCLAIAALFVFVYSASTVTSQNTPARGWADHTEAVYADMANIRRLAEGKRVLAPEELGSREFFGTDEALDWLLSGSLVRHGLFGQSIPPHDFLLIPHHRQEAGLLTPDNKVVFLYDASVEPASVQRSFVDAIVSASALAAASAFRLYVNDTALSYVKEEGCVFADVLPRFFLHVTPVFPHDLEPSAGVREGPAPRMKEPSAGVREGPAPRMKEPSAGAERHRPLSHVNLDFGFQRHGVAVGDSCAARVPLPRYPIASIRTGQFTNAGNLWEETVALASSTYRKRYAAVGLLEPDARTEFHLYLRLTEQERSLTYVKTPCAPADVVDRFFLHVTPARREDLPENRQASGFGNLDFDFGRRGALFDGKCVAIAPLPKYAFTRIRTGQWADGRNLWDATLELRPELQTR